MKDSDEELAFVIYDDSEDDTPAQEPKSNIIVITDENFEKNILQSKGVSLVFFTADWCGPCRIMKPKIKQISVDYEQRLLVGEVNVDDNKGLSDQYLIRSIPTLILFKDGVPVDKRIGSNYISELDNWLDTYLQ